MFYTIYKTTNKINGKIYIGKHQTKNLEDNYIGSGKILQNAITKHGIENFEKEILFGFDNEADMNAKEAELVTKDFVLEDTNYNLCPGGHGGFGYINTNDIGNVGWKHNLVDNTHQRKGGVISQMNPNPARIEAIKKAHRDGKIPYTGMKDKKHQTETKKLMSESHKGSKNSQYGKQWIYSNDEKKSVRIDIDQKIPEGWIKGRKIKFD